MEPRLTQQQSQKLVLSPQLMQYLRLLQMPSTELIQAIDEELQANPLLEETAPKESEDSPEEPNESAPSNPERPAEELNLSAGTAENLPLPSDPVWDDFEDTNLPLRDPREIQRQRDFQENLLTSPETLSDYLMWQIRFLELTPEEFLVAEEIIGNINEQGFLASPVEEISAATGQSQDAVEKVLKKVQSLEPSGVAARDLRESLSIQLARKGEEAGLARKIVDEHFHLLQKRDWPHIAKLTGENMEDVLRASELIIRLEPRPGRNFVSGESLAITPDAVISVVDGEENKFKVDIIDDKVPELRIHPYYRRLLRSRELDPNTRAFLKSKLQNAINFINAIKQRKSTLRLITDQIVEDQQEFFERGFSHLKPMRLKDISEKLGIHESTVSRAIQAKYVQTPQGTIPYRNFFSSRLENSGGEDESQKSMLEKIRLLIASEDPAKPLSDQEIVAKFQAEGIKIARRTVAKYRDLLRILPSHLRRKRSVS